MHVILTVAEGWREAYHRLSFASLNLDSNVTHVSVATVQLTTSWLAKLWLFNIVAGLSITGHSQAKVLAQPQFRVSSNLKMSWTGCNWLQLAWAD